MKRFLAAILAGCLLCPVCVGAEAPAVSASCAVLMDAESGRVLYEKQAHEQRLIASITKLMTALVAVESTPDLSTVFTVGQEHLAEGSSMYLRVGEQLTLRELLYGLLLVSGNDAAMAIAGGCAGDVETFVAWMNQRAEGLGMEHTHFANPSGLDQEGHYSTAYDMALLAREVLKREELSEIVATRSITIGERSLTNHNKLLWRYEGCQGMKTGYTEEAGRTLVSCAKRGEQTLICVTLKAPDDWADHAALLDYGFEAWHIHPLARRDKVFRKLPVTGSLLPQVEVVTAADVAYPLSGKERVRAEITLPELVRAPVKAGTIAGRLTFFLDSGEAIGETYLLYGADIPENAPKPSLFERVREALLAQSGGPLPAAALLEKGFAF